MRVQSGRGQWTERGQGPRAPNGAASGLASKAVENSITFEEAEVTLVCRKLFKQRLEPANIIDDQAKAFYVGDAEHDMYIGEVVEII